MQDLRRDLHPARGSERQRFFDTFCCCYSEDMNCYLSNIIKFLQSFTVPKDFTLYQRKLNTILALTSSRAIYLVNVDFVPDVSEAVSVSIIRDLCNECCVRTLYIYAHSCLLSQSRIAWMGHGRRGERRREREDKVGRGSETVHLRGSKKMFLLRDWRFPDNTRSSSC
jgi:hypothetical protein